MTDAKSCATCARVLALDKFSMRNGGFLGRAAHCRECVAETRAKRGRSAEYEKTTAKRLQASAGARQARADAARLKAESLAAAKEERERAKAAEIALKPWLDPSLSAQERRRVRRASDPSFMILERTRSRLRRKGIKGAALKDIRQALNAKRGNVRRLVLEERLGFTIEDLRSHLESQFTCGMDWSAFSGGAIHIDHIKPLSTFDLTDAEQVNEAWALSNLRPLWALDNMRRPKDGRDIVELASNDNDALIVAA